MEREATRLERRVTSALSFSISLPSVELEWETAATVGEETSTTLSAMSASLARSVVPSAEARTIDSCRTYGYRIGNAHVSYCTRV